MDNILKKLEKYRLEHGLSQTALAKKVGVSFQTINRWLNGHVRPNRLQIEKIQKFLEKKVFPRIATDPSSTPPGVMRQIFRFENPRQERIYRSLQKIGSGPANMYRDAVQLMNQTSLQLSSTSHLVGHLLREIESSLLSVLAPVSPSERDGLLSKFEKLEEDLKVLLTAKGISEIVDLDKKIEKFIDALGETRAQIIQRILKTFDSGENDGLKTLWIKLSLHKYAHRENLFEPRPVDDDFLKLWEHFQKVLDEILRRFESKYLLYHSAIDQISEEEPTTVIKRLTQEIPNSWMLLKYFFSKIKGKSPAWLDVLDRKGFFSSPPAPVLDDEKGTIHFPPWPASEYLAFMAKTTPGKVYEIIKKTPFTANIRICEDFLDAAADLPAAQTAELIGKILEWIKPPYSHFIPEKAAKIMVHLASGGQGDAALEVAKGLMGVELEKTSASKRKSKFYRPEPVAKVDSHTYVEIFKKYFLKIIPLLGLKSLEFLCDLLEQALNIYTGNKASSAPEDHSYVWYSNLSAEPQEYGNREIKSILAFAVKKAAEDILNQQPEKAESVMNILEKRNRRIFQRIALHVLKSADKSFPDIVKALLVRRDLFDSYEVKKEYWELATEYFGILSPAQQETILSWIYEGPKFSKDSEKNEDERKQRKEAWQRDRLGWIKNGLTDSHKTYYESLEKKYGAPEAPFTFSVSTGWTGPTSPKSSEELLGMTSAQVVEFLKAWTAPEGPWDHSIEGLGRVLSSAVVKDPQRFAADALLFKGLDPTYVRSLLDGFRSSLKEHKKQDWNNIIDLCLWIVEQPRTIEGRKVKGDRLDADPDWGWTRKTIANLLEGGFSKGEASIPFDFREKVWTILRILLQDPEPDASMEDSDPLTLSINTVRGQSMHTLVRYALWIRRTWEEQRQFSKVENGFQEMPEVKEALESHLEEKSLAIRAVYGQWLPWLHLLDRTWVSKNLSIILPPQKNRMDSWEAAWKTYICYVDAYDEMLPVLRDEYLRAIDRIEEETDKRNDMETSLSGHICVFTSRGKINLEDDQNIFTKFWGQAPPMLRTIATESFGRMLYNTEQAIEEKTQKRFQQIWDYCEKKASPGKTELASFGWWFASGKMPNDWAFKKIISIIEACHEIEADSFIIEHLLKVCRDFPEDSVKLIELMIEYDAEGWRVRVSSDQIRSIIQNALQSKNEAAVRAAKAFVNKLASWGHDQFNDLV